ncbi:hypothetical protein KHQ82_06090 [Mycoplasmatota bacterium]|nr:hypothetical protein KHQ82_06090 [Mycoplasmatota bacterium]
MKCIKCGSENLAPGDFMYECRECGFEWISSDKEEILVDKSELSAHMEK